MSYDVAVVGTGDPDAEEGAAMAYNHATAYREIESTELLACADLVPGRARAFASEYGIDAANVFENYREMLRETAPDVVSVCVPPAHHAELVIGCAESGVPEAIHCEKPMADTPGDARRMIAACEDAGVQLTFNHQRRFGTKWRRAKELLDDGAIGDLRRLEMAAPNLLDWGTHVVDLCHFYNDEHAAEWVLGALDYRDEQVLFGEHNPNQDLVLWSYENGVYGLASTGEAGDLVGCRPRLIGTDGRIEVDRQAGDEANLSIRRDGTWETLEADSTHQGEITRALEHVVGCIGTAETPELSADKALRATDVIFGAWESVRQQRRVDLPLEIDDNPLEAMIEAGDLDPE
ncbi:MAG: Gfo/Idh/MocA family protein [Halobacteriales archaeon]